MYALMIKPYTDKIFKKLAKRNPKQLKIIYKKLDEIRKTPYHNYKFLRAPLQGFNRVHIDRHFVLIFKINHEKEIIEVWFYGHHDEVYKGKFIFEK